MKHTGNPQTNTKVYWNDSYGNPDKASEYKSFSHRFPTVLSFIKDGDKVIDIGCGVANLARLVKKERKESEVWGVDISNVAIEQNKKEWPEDKYFQGYIGSLGFLPSGYFDVVFSGEVLEHLDEPQVLLDEGRRILKQGGILIVTTPMDNRIPSAEHMWVFSKEDVRELYEKSGFKNITFVDLPDLEHMLVIFAVGEK